MLQILLEQGQSASESIFLNIYELGISNFLGGESLEIKETVSLIFWLNSTMCLNFPVYLIWRSFPENMSDMGARNDL